MFEIVEHVDVLNPESIETCAECPKLKHSFEIGNDRNDATKVGLKEHVTLILDGPIVESCSYSFSASAYNVIVASNTESLVFETPLEPGKVIVRVEFSGADCPCENVETELSIVEPSDLVFSIAREKVVKTKQAVDEQGNPAGQRIYEEYEEKKLWHIEDRVSAGIQYRIILKPVGVSFARLNVWEGYVIPTSETDSYFDGIDLNLLSHNATPQEPWNSDAFSGSAAKRVALEKGINTKGIIGADQVFGSFDCKDQRDATIPGTLIWEIPTFRETTAGGSKRIATVQQEFVHEAKKSKLKNSKSYVGKGGTSSAKIRVTAPTNLVGYTSTTSQAIQPCN